MVGCPCEDIQPISAGVNVVCQIGLVPLEIWGRRGNTRQTALSALQPTNLTPRLAICNASAACTVAAEHGQCPSIISSVPHRPRPASSETEETLVCCYIYSTPSASLCSLTCPLSSIFLERNSRSSISHPRTCFILGAHCLCRGPSGY